MTEDRVVSGMRPTGALHLGHFHGALKNWVRLQSTHDCYFIIANYHAFTTRAERSAEIRSDCLEIVRDYLAMGIDPDAATVFLQSEIPAIHELCFLFAMLLPFNRVMRNPTLKDEIKDALTARSPLQRYPDANPKLAEKWEEELDAAIEAEYRRQRAELLLTLQWWLRDVWLRKLGTDAELAAFPELADAVTTVSARINLAEALDNLRVVEHTQRLLRTNVNEALALEVGLLKLRL